MTSAANDLEPTADWPASDLSTPRGPSGDGPPSSLAPRDRVVLTGLRARGRHGVYDFEREQGQDFVVDVVLSLDLAPASTTDDLRGTVDYGVLAEAVVADVEGEPLNLIEALAERVARTCLRQPGVDEVEVTVHKPQAPISVAFADVAVTLRRSRA
ncbi:dihydroneopterin aldolase [Microlunatus sagamiharensis]|uniref:7,8-dihydroneopterin aldolase n=1 Tax=Microlunatus sagamiharensis TaxID=546874 RepID=A0A1H2NGQ7_9ACTN|nr:dihydroneopterin aldolase [Microlunatus sagamiharensis]